MHVRLAFSVAIQVDADILLVDEVLAVGDAAFQQKCFDVFNRDARRGPHDRVRHPRHGLAEPLLPPRAAARARLGRPPRRAPRGRATATWSSTSARDPERGARPRTERGGDGEARIVEAWVEDEHGERQPSLAQGQRITLQGACALRRSRSRTPSPACTCSTKSTWRSSSPAPTREHERSGRFAAGEEVAVLVRASRTCSLPAATPAVHARPPRHRAGPDGSLRGRVLVRGHRRRTRTGRLVDLPVEVERRADPRVAPPTGAGVSAPRRCRSERLGRRSGARGR